MAKKLVGRYRRLNFSSRIEFSVDANLRTEAGLSGPQHHRAF